MSPQERNLLLDSLRFGQTRILNLVSGLTPAQWSFHENEARWSIADCLEHVTGVEERVLDNILRLLETPPEPEKRLLTAGKDALVAERIPNRMSRVEAPERARPVGRWPLPDELLRAFLQLRERTLEFAASTEGDLRSHAFPHMALGELDGYQWLLMVSLHGERHARQIEEIKNAPGFPASQDDPFK